MKDEVKTIYWADPIEGSKMDVIKIEKWSTEEIIALVRYAEHVLEDRGWFTLNRPGNPFERCENEKKR